MSAYICHRNHIKYLVYAATSPQLAHAQNSTAFYYGDGHKLRLHDDEAAATAADMLWQENIRSVSFRYPGEAADTLPGPVGESYAFKPHEFNRFIPHFKFSPIEVIKAADCYEYQSCEHPEWKDSPAKKFVDALRSAAITRISGYDSAPWGSPEHFTKALATV